MMEVVVSEQSISPDSAGVWHLSVTSLHQAESARDGAAVAGKEEDTNN